MTPAASISAKAALAVDNFSSDSGRTLQWMGAVSAVSTLWWAAGGGWSKGCRPATSGNSSSRRRWIRFRLYSPLVERTWRSQAMVR